MDNRVDNRRIGFSIQCPESPTIPVDKVDNAFPAQVRSTLSTATRALVTFTASRAARWNRSEKPRTRASLLCRL